MDDDELIAQVAAGSDDALRELFARHASWLAVRLRRMLSDSDVEDVLQETFLAVWRGARRYRPEGAAGGWLWTIGSRQAALYLRRGGPATALLPDHSHPVMPSVVDPADAVAERTDLERALTTLGSPDSPERETWQRLYVEDRPVAEVAEITGVPVGTVKSRAHRTRRLLQAALLGRSQMDGGSQ